MTSLLAQALFVRSAQI